MTVINFPGVKPRTTLNECDAWNAYLDAVAQLHAEFPNVNVSTCKRVVTSYETFCFAMSKGGKSNV